MRHPNAYGPYGQSPTNPLVAQDITESRNLLSQLVLSNGSPVSFSREGSVKAPNLIEPVDKYGIYDSAGNRVSTLYVYIYFHVTVYAAPAGFSLASQFKKPWWKFW